jgi:hypothetical protein
LLEPSRFFPGLLQGLFLEPSPELFLALLLVLLPVLFPALLPSWALVVLPRMARGPAERRPAGERRALASSIDRGPHQAECWGDPARERLSQELPIRPAAPEFALILRVA